jgi:hypothetical protein
MRMNGAPRRDGRWRSHVVAFALVVAGAAGLAVDDAAGQPPSVPADALGRLGPLLFDPGLVVSSGYDTNPWRESQADAVTDTVESYVTPQIASWLSLGHLRVDGFGAIELVKAGEAVTSKNHQFGSNLLWGGPKLRPYLQWTSKHTNANPTGFEVGRKSMRNENDMQVGSSVSLGGSMQAVGFVRRTQTDWDADALYQTSSLREKLNRLDSAMGGGVEFRLTPLTSVHVSAEQSRSEFLYSPVRNGSGSRLVAGVAMVEPAIISGTAEFGIRRFQSQTSGVAFSGLFGNLAMTRHFVTDTTLGVRFERDLQFSYDTTLAYFVGQSMIFTIVQPIGESIATQFSAGHHALHYDRSIAADQIPTNAVSEYVFVLGHKVRGRTWIGASMEWAQASGNQPWQQRRVIGFLTFGTGPFQRLDRPIPFQH